MNIFTKFTGTKNKRAQLYFNLFVGLSSSFIICNVISDTVSAQTLTLSESENSYMYVEPCETCEDSDIMTFSVEEDTDICTVNYFEEVKATTIPMRTDYIIVEYDDSYTSTSEELNNKDSAVDAYNNYYYYPELSLSKDLQQYTAYLCDTIYTDVSYELALAVMWEESNFQCDAVGYNSNGTTDTGLMQINTICTTPLQDEFGYVDLVDPYYNIEAGLFLLNNMCRKYGESCGLMAYGLGEYGMLQYTADGNWSTYASRKVLSLKNKICNELESAII